MEAGGGPQAPKGHSTPHPVTQSVGRQPAPRGGGLGNGDLLFGIIKAKSHGFSLLKANAGIMAVRTVQKHVPGPHAGLSDPEPQAWSQECAC